jgi:hypothetical protein
MQKAPLKFIGKAAKFGHKKLVHYCNGNFDYEKG